MQIVGISESIARQRLEEDGPNELPVAKSRAFLILINEVLSEPIVALLVGCGAIYMIIGDRQFMPFKNKAYSSLSMPVTLFADVRKYVKNQMRPKRPWQKAMPAVWPPLIQVESC